jgi:PST family polysaccharide transporter
LPLVAITDLTPSTDIGARAVRGGLAIVFARFGAQGLRLLLTATLARLLTPDDYGLVAVIVALSGLGMVLQDLGLSAATIQRQQITTQQISALFWFNVMLGTLVATIGVLSAPLIATLFARPDAAPLAAALFAGVLIPSLSVQHRALLHRQMRFAEQAMIGVIALIIAGGCAIVVAARGGGPWALVTLTLVSDLVTLVLSWRASGFVPERLRWQREVAEMLSFGGGFLLFRVLGYLAQNLHVVLLGRNAGVAAAGLFTRAHTIANLLLGYTTDPAGKVAIAALPRYANDPAAFTRFYLRCLAVMMLSAAPIAVFAGAFATDLVRLLLGPQWQATGVLLSILAAGMAIQPALHSTGWIYLARGEMRGMVLWGVVGWSVMIGGALIGLRWGADGIAWAWTLSLYLLLAPCLLAAFRGTPLRLGPTLVIVVRPILAALLAGALTLSLRSFFESLPLIPRLLLNGVVFGASYAALVCTIFGQWALVTDLYRALRARPKRGERRQ